MAGRIDEATRRATLAETGLPAAGHAASKAGAGLPAARAPVSA